MPTAKPSPDTTLEWTPNPRAHTLSLPEQIAERIGNDIIHGRYEPGARIQEQDVASGFQVSRGPVREALRILERDGLIQIHARRGAQVTELSVTELYAIFEPRISLNGLAARRAAERRDAASIATLKAAVDRVSALSGSADTDSYLKASYVAHRSVCEASGNTYITRLVFLLAHQTLRYARLGLSTVKRRQQSAKTWRRLVAAIQGGDPDDAQSAAEQLARESRDAAVRLLTESQRVAAEPPAATAPAPRSPAPTPARQPKRVAKRS